jgi:putative sterol carrier protein
VGKGYNTRPTPCRPATRTSTLTISDDDFARLVAGKLSPQTAFLMRKLKLSGSMGQALKLQPILDAAAPRPKL